MRKKAAKAFWFSAKTNAKLLFLTLVLRNLKLTAAKDKKRSINHL